MGVGLPVGLPPSEFFQFIWLYGNPPESQVKHQKAAKPVGLFFIKLLIYNCISLKMGLGYLHFLT